MKRFDDVAVSKHQTPKLKLLVVVVASMMAMPISQADVAGKRIGDLEIYKPAETGKTTITMMLDTSGSMTNDQVNYACDLPTGTSFVKRSEMSDTNPQYKRNYCALGTRYFFRLDRGANQWYRCGNSDGSGTTDYNFSLCGTKINYSPSVEGFDYVTSASNNSYFYLENKVYDRITRLKDAIFTLMDNTQLDPKKVAIGIGQYSSHSGEDNKIKFDSDGSVQTSADGRTGKMLLPAALLDETQRQKIKDIVAAVGAGGGTPTANAYAEVGAYMLGTKTSKSQSGFAKSAIATKTKSGTSGTYISPLVNPSSCDGRGIYFLTDGAPNNSTNPLALMKEALGNSGSKFSVVTSNTLPPGSGTETGMPEVGAFAKALRDSTISPLGTDQEIYTAVVGFGADFDVDRAEDAAKPESKRVIRNLPYTNPKTGVTTNRDFYNCENIVGSTAAKTKDARNACNWGEKAHPSLPGVGGYGEGGFFSAQSTEDIVDSIVSFVSDLDQTLPSTPSGTISIPDDPYRADSQLAVAYYPTLQPKVADSAAIWEGNMKKYKLSEGTLFGLNNSKLFLNIKGELNPATIDLWSDKNYAGANDKVESGGFYSQLNTPNKGVTSVRNLFVEDWKSKTDKTPLLRKFGVNASGKVTVDGNPLTDASFQDTSTYSQETLRILLNFLGFDKLPDTTTSVKSMALSTANASTAIKVVGATIHSTPASVSYLAELDDNGRVKDKRDDYVLFGSTEGGLHLVDAADKSAGGGKEKFIIIPREMLANPKNAKALIKDATKDDSIGVPNFGIDAPWLVTADYKYDFENKRVDVDIDNASGKGVFAYGGLRMGGEALYGLNLNDSSNPTMMFSITPASSGFSRMGQIWSKPTKAKIRTSNNATDKGTDVLIFGGGYDMCYEDESFQVGINSNLLGACSNKATAQGNAVYIINAKTGALIWSASSSGSPTTTVSSMTNSVVAGVTVLDRNNDGFMDHIYFADLGGQLFRADFTNAGFKKPVSPTKEPTAETSFTNTRVTQILKSAYSGTDTRFNYRFYERPVVSFYRNDGGSLFALINVISGDRSSPLSKIRDNTKADRLYGIMDSDVTKADNIFYASNFTVPGNANGQKIVDLTANSTTNSSLAELPSAVGTLSASGFTEAQKNTFISTLKAGTKKGWYYPLTRFDGYGNVRYSKGIGKSEVVDSFLYTTVYNPDMSYGTVSSCAAEITGGSERQLYCLPYGICMDDASKDGTGGFMRAGKGIQELTLGPRSAALSTQRLLIGTQSLTDLVNNRFNFGGDGDKGLFNPKPQGLTQSLTDSDQKIGSGSAPSLIHNERFTLQPKTWYEVD